MFEVGQVIAGKYRIDREVGQGGMGSVVAATHLQLGTEVALKYLKGNVATDPTTVARFLREARAAAQLRSEHICRVLDVAEEAGSPYIIMEMLEGSDLNKLSKAGPLDPGTVVEYVRQACAGLAEAHGRGIVHRDLKPANLFLTHRADGSVLVKVLDFGVAKAPDMPGAKGGPRLTSSVHLVGSPAYMSPEQIASSRDVDARTDVWSLGVILFRLISGHIPFDGDNMAILAMQIVDGPMPPLPHASPALAAIVERCLAKDPADRIQTVAELAKLLRPFAGVASIRETNIDIVPVTAIAAAYDDASTVNHRGPPVAITAPPPTTAQRPLAKAKAPPVATLRMQPVGKATAAAAESPLSARITAQVEPAVTPFVVVSHLAAPSMSSAMTAPTVAPLAPPVTALAESSESQAPRPEVPQRSRGWIAPLLAVAALACVIGAWKLMSTTSETAASPSPSEAAPAIAEPTPAPSVVPTPTPPTAPTPSVAASIDPAPAIPVTEPPRPTDVAVHTAKPKTGRVRATPVKSKTTPAKPPTKVESGAKTGPTSEDFGASRI